MKKLAFVGLLLALTFPVAGHAEDYTYTTNLDNTIAITGYTGSGGDVAIPDTINSLPVTSIGDSAFNSCTNLTSVTVPNSVINIGGWAFGWCVGLTNVTIGNGVTNIGVGTFAFCTDLGTISVDELNSFYSSTNGVLFDKDQTALIQCPSGKAGIYTIPSSVTSIGGWAFGWCTGLTNVTIGNGVTSIGEFAFYYCTGLTGVYFEGNAPSVGGDVFSGADNATIYRLSGAIGWPTVPSAWAGRPTALYDLPGWYTLTINSGKGGGMYTNGLQVVISADDAVYGKTFDQWIGDVQFVASATSSTTTVAMPEQAVTLTATYKILPGYYTLTVSNGTGGGIYSNGAQVAIAAAPVLGKAFDRWIGDTQVVASVTSSTTIVTIPEQAVTLTATYMEDHAKNLVFYSDFENTYDDQPIITTDDLNGATRAPPSVFDQTPSNGWTSLYLNRIPTNSAGRFRAGAVSQVAYIALEKNALGLSAILAEPVSFTGTEAIRFSYDFQPNSGVKGTAQIITGYDVDNNIVFKIKMNSIAGSPQYLVWVNDIPIGFANRSGNSADPLNSISLMLDATGITATLFNPLTLETNTVSGIPGWGGSALNHFKLASEGNLPSNFDYDNFQVWAISPGCTLRVNSGTGDGLYTNGTQVVISADMVSGQAFNRWVGDTQYVDSVTSSSAIVTMSTNPVTLTATYVPDNAKPALKITAPTAELKVFATNGLFIVQGTASDDPNLVSDVLVKLNGGSWMSANTTNGWKNWSLPVELMPGVNTIRAYSVDSAMNRSPGKMVKCSYLQGAIIQVQANGEGSIKPDYNGQMLEIGKRYQIGAKGIKNTSVFTDWTQGIGGSVITSKREFTFVMQTNLVLTANFRSLSERAAMADVAIASSETPQATIVVDGLGKDWANVQRASFSYASVTQDVAVALNGNNIALLLSSCPFETSDNVLVYFKLRLSYGSGDNRHSVDLWTSGSVLYGMVDGKVIAGLEAVLLNGVLEVKLPVERTPRQVTIEEIGCGMDLGGGTLTELFKLTPLPALTK